MANSNSTILTASALDLAARMQAGEVTSVALTKAFLRQIAAHNLAGRGLRAVISPCPETIALARAEELDREREQGRVRSRLHGVPVLVKDAIVTDPALGMPSTAGSAVFAGMTAKGNAPVAQKIIDAGMLILGKTNMTEFCGLKSATTPIGWSAGGGQTLSPYRQPHFAEPSQPVCGGSSSGSAAGVAAGFAPLAFGTETTGSLVYPASVHGLYGLTATRGAVDPRGVFALGSTFDSVGTMARGAADVRAGVEVLLGAGGGGGGLESFEGMGVGILPCSWGTGNVHEKAGEGKWERKDLVDKYASAAETIRSKGANVVFPLEMPEASILKHKGQTLHQLAYDEFPSNIKNFLTNFEPNAEVTSLADIIAWNTEHAAEALPEPHTTQTELVAALASSIPEETYTDALTSLHTLATSTLEESMRGLDVILSASDATLVSYAAHAGWPLATVPLAQAAANGQPFGFFVLARKGREDVLLRFMAAFEAALEGVERPEGMFD